MILMNKLNQNITEEIDESNKNINNLNAGCLQFKKTNWNCFKHSKHLITKILREIKTHVMLFGEKCDVKRWARLKKAIDNIVDIHNEKVLKF